MRKIISGMIIALLAISVFPLTLNVQLTKATPGTIYIRADGSVEPLSAHIQRIGDKYYVFTDNITDYVVVERDNIVLNGAGFWLTGTGAGYGIDLTGGSNVTVKSIIIRKFGYGIYLSGGSSFGNTLYANRIINSTWGGIAIYGASGNSISANTITNTTGDGIYLEESSNNSISANTITNSNQDGIALYSESNSNTISANTITNNKYDGIYLHFSSGNSISANTITNNNEIGIVLGSSIGNSISANTITNNGDGIYLSSSSNSNNIFANTVTNNNCGIVLGSSSNGNSISANTITNNNEIGIWLYQSSSNSIFANTITNNNGDNGIILVSSDSNSISANTITNNNVGIKLASSSGNSISANTITNNKEIGIWLYYESNSFIWHNNFVDNTVQAYVTPGYANTWDDGYPSGGNYWSDYTGIDLYKGPNQNVAGTDEIGDTARTLNADNIDHYPLLNPWTPTDVASLVVRGSNNIIYYRTYSATTDSWNDWTALPGATMDSPAAALCNNELHLVVRGMDGNTLWHGYVSLMNQVFSGWTLLSGSSPSAPTLTSNGTALSLVVRGADNRIWYSVYSFNPRSWGSWNALTGSTVDSPAAAMLGNNLHVVVRGSDGNSLWHIVVKPDTGVVRNWIGISGSTPSKPVLTANQTANKLYLSVRGANDQIYWRTYDGAADSWAGWNTVPTGTTPDAPAAAILNNKLHMVVSGSGGTTLWHGNTDLSTGTFSGWTLLSGSTPSAPTLTS